MLSSCQKAIRLIALSQVVSGSAASEEPGMPVSLVFGNREISSPPSPAEAVGRVVKAETP
jgi:hypothetical protein